MDLEEPLLPLPEASPGTKHDKAITAGLGPKQMLLKKR
jgi:hypothetical protein